MKRLLLTVSALVLLTGCPFDPKVDGSSEEKMQASIKEIMQDLTPTEQTEFQDSMKIIMFADVNDLSDIIALGQNPKLIMASFLARVDGKTASEVVALGNQIKAQKSSSDPATKATQTDIKQIEKSAKADATKEVLSKTLSVSLKSKKFTNGQYGQDRIDIVLTLTNNGEKDIKGVKGLLVFKDMFGDEIKIVNLSYDEGIKAKATSQYDGGIDFNQFKNEDQKLAVTETDKIDFSFIPETIIFGDGTKVEIE